MRSFKHILASVALGAAISGGGGAQASVDLLTNGGFEAPNVGEGHFIYPNGAMDGWTYSNAAVVNAEGASPWYGAAPPPGHEGLQFAALESLGSLSQTFRASDPTLRLTWLQAGRPTFGVHDGVQVYDVALNGRSLHGYRTFSGEAFTDEALFLTGLTIGDSYILSFRGLVTHDGTAFLDRVSLMGGVPEPATWAMMLAGFALIGGALRAGPRRQVETAA